MAARKCCPCTLTCAGIADESDRPLTPAFCDHQPHLAKRTDAPSPPLGQTLPLLDFMGDASPAQEPKDAPVRFDNQQHHNIRDIMIGEAGQHVVLARLLSMGVPAHMAMPGLAYDLLVDMGCGGLLRVQVKTSATLSSGKYRFALKRGFFRSKRGMFDYTADDYDIAAFVCLPAFQVFFKAGPLTRFAAGPHVFQNPGLAAESLRDAATSQRRWSGQHTPRPWQLSREAASKQGGFR